MTASVIEFAQRAYDNHWVRWEYIDAKKIGETSTWSRFKWVATGVWSEKPVAIMESLSKGFKGRVKNSSTGKFVYKYQL